MIPTITIHGSDEVMAPCGNLGTFIRGKRVSIKITKKESSIPFFVDATAVSDLIQEAMIGMEFSTIFSGKQFSKTIPKEAQIAYAEEVIETLELAGKLEAARELKRLAPNLLDVYIFEPGTFVVVGG